MPQHRKKYVLLKRPAKKGHVWYYRLPNDRVHRSTGKKLRYEAEEYVEKEVLGTQSRTGHTLSDFLEPYWIAETCPHVTRLRLQGKTISDEYIRHQRRRLEMYLLPDEISNRPVAEITHGELLDFQSRLVSRNVGRRTVNKTLGALRTAIGEGCKRKDLDHDFGAGLGEVKVEQRASDTFSASEIRALFAENPGVWRDPVEFTVFLTAAATGARRGEILPMVWEQIDFEEQIIRIDRALKSSVGESIGSPKSGKARTAFLSAKLAAALKQLRTQSPQVLPGPRSYVFGYADGSLRQVGWWRGAFRKAMIKAGFFSIDKKGTVLNLRGLRPHHSLRGATNTLLLDSGADPERIRRALGWQDRSVQELYTTAEQLSLRDLRQRMDGILGGA